MKLSDLQKIEFGFKDTARCNRAHEFAHFPHLGVIVDALRALPPGATLSLDELGPRVRSDYTAEHAGWLRELVAGLARHGLVALFGPEDDLRVALPT